MNDGMMMIQKVTEHFKVNKPVNAGGKKATKQNTKENKLSKKEDSRMGHLKYEAGILDTTVTFTNFTYKGHLT